MHAYACTIVNTRICCCVGKLECNARVIFQPAEEVGQGARAMIQEQALAGVDFIVGMFS